ncbi:EAL domain-containing protein [Vibrio sp. YIC-376]|uniref:EAL domain-containing protein n=1 Tax=Vibrio sp. YIC-376 TaxID=3136162 RepID=UPI00402AB2F4
MLIRFIGTKLSNRQVTLVIITIVMIAVHLVGYSVISSAAISSLDSNARYDSEMISLRVLSLLNSVQSINESNVLLWRDDCQHLIEHGQELVLINPYIRSISRARNGHVDCSTITKDKRVGLDITDTWTHNRLSYFPQSPLLKPSIHSGDVIVNVHEKGVQMLYGILPEHFSNFLYTDLNHDHYRLLAVIDDYLFSADAPPMLMTDSSLVELKEESKLSNQFLDIYYDITPSDYWAYILDRWLSVYLIFTFVSNAVAGVTYYASLRFDWKTMAIKEGIIKRQFVPYAQPIVNQYGDILGIEILARWLHPKLGLISPAYFIESAERSGQISEITHVLMDKVRRELHDCRQWLDNGFHVGINACAAQITRRDFFEDCQLFLNEFGENLVLVVELTERQKIPLDLLTLEAIDSLKSMGIKIAADDFGTEHSTLSYLRMLQFDYLKIDKQFTDLILKKETELPVIENLIDLVHRLGIESVAEGVEEKVQVDFLSARGITNFQGYYFVKPEPLHDFIESRIKRKIPISQEITPVSV